MYKPPLYLFIKQTHHVITLNKTKKKLNKIIFKENEKCKNPITERNIFKIKKEEKKGNGLIGKVKKEFLEIKKILFEIKKNFIIIKD